MFFKKKKKNKRTWHLDLKVAMWHFATRGKHLPSNLAPP